MTRALKKIHDVDFSHLATKEDLIQLEQKLDTKINSVEQKLDTKITSLEQRLDTKLTSVEQRLESKISDVRYDILKWVIGAIGFQTLVIVGAVVALSRNL